jgi:uncharacterized protein (DUF58 family)
VSRPAVLALVAAALVAAGAALPSHALFAAGAGLACATAAAMVCVVEGARTVSVSTQVPVLEAEEGSTLTVLLSVVLQGRRPLRVEAQLAGKWRPLASGEIAVEVRLGSRGAHELPPIPVRVTDPLGLAERRIGTCAGIRALALPRPQGGASFLPAGMPRAAGGEQELVGLRSYVPGTPLSRIDWRSLARAGELLQRDFAPEPAAAVPLVVVDTCGAADREAVDWAARAAVAAVTRLAAGGVRVLLPGDRTAVHISADLRRWPEVRRRLALMEAGTAEARPEGGDSGPVFTIRARDHRSTPPASAGSTANAGR